tara:strand:+ start:332 stop:580 length:249 start_codon:yes stop_codon:yes gene_type:complete
MKTTKKKAGRPRGSKNNEYNEVVDVKTHCPHCSKTNVMVTMNYPPTNINEIIEGVKYNTLSRRLMKCADCGLSHVKKTRENK